jgi:hypothetical protein
MVLNDILNNISIIMSKTEDIGIFDKDITLCSDHDIDR